MAREHPRYADMEFPEYEFQEFPMIYYPGAKNQKAPYDAKGKRLKGIRVENEAELAAVMKGDSEPEPEAETETDASDAGDGAVVVTQPTGSSVQRVRTAEDERQELIQLASTKGVQFDKRWSAARIQDAIDAANKTSDAVV